MSTEATPSPARRPPGRPRRTTPEVALEAAMQTFWAEGYEAASIDTLCRTMGIPRASLYQSWGNKEGLFRAALDHYAETRMATVVAALGPNGTLRDDLAAFLQAAVDLATSDKDPPGCLVASVLSDAAGLNLRLREELDRRFAAFETRIEARLAVASEEVPAPPREMAALVAAVARGLTLRARSGIGPAALRSTAATAVAVLLPRTGEGALRGHAT